MTLPRKEPMPRSSLVLLLLAATACNDGPLGDVTDVTLGAYGFATPESAQHDPDADVYLVSNINGDPFTKDDNGFISRLAPDGKQLAMRWIDGARPDVTLHAPKGIGLTADELWVADIDEVRRFDRKTGAPRGSVPILGATFLNDVAVGPDGSVYVTDTGVGPGFVATGTDAIWQIDPKDGTLTPFQFGMNLDQPNGLWVDQDGAFAVTWKSGKLLTVLPSGERAPDIQLPKAQLDGIVRLPDGRFLITSWEGRCAYLLGKDGKATEWMHPLLDAPADLGLDLRRGRALIPAFQKDELRITLFPLP